MRKLQCVPSVILENDDTEARDSLFRLLEKLKNENFFGKCIVTYKGGMVHRVEVCRMMTVDDLKSI